MLRQAALLLCAAIAFAVSAAPAPVFKPDRTRWLGLDGWDKPVDPAGDCRFDRDRGKLTMTVRGQERDYEPNGVVLYAIRLMRDVDGDFVAVVRVGGNYCPAMGRVKGAGLLMLAGENHLAVMRLVYP